MWKASLWKKNNNNIKKPFTNDDQNHHSSTSDSVDYQVIHSLCYIGIINTKFCLIDFQSSFIIQLDLEKSQLRILKKLQRTFLHFSKADETKILHYVHPRTSKRNSAFLIDSKKIHKLKWWLTQKSKLHYKEQTFSYT